MADRAQPGSAAFRDITVHYDHSFYVEFTRLAKRKVTPLPCLCVNVGTVHTADVLRQMIEYIFDALEVRDY